MTTSLMKGQWIDSSSPPALRSKISSDPGDASDGGTTVDLTPIINGTFTNAAGTFRYQPGSIHLFSNRPARPSAPIAYQQANADLLAKKPQGKKIVCAIVNQGTTDVKEMCLSVFGVKGTRETTALVRSAKGAFFVQDNTFAPEAPHLGFCIRTRRGRTQLLDTGGFGVDGRGNGVTAVSAPSAFHTGNFDDPLTSTIKGAQPFRGTGVFPAMDDASATKMRDHVLNVLRKARPIGLARLILLKRPLPQFLDSKNVKPALLYISPLLTMFLNDDSEESQLSNYAISRYMWSLRDLPGAAKVEAVWMIYTPKFSLARALLDKGRKVSATKLADELRQVGATAAKPAKSVHQFIRENTAAIADVASRSDGTVRVLGKAGRSDPHPLAKIVDINGLPFDKPFPEPTSFTTPPYFDG